MFKTTTFEVVRTGRKCPKHGETDHTRQNYGLVAFLREAFLPVGYPDSVSGDYTVYQMYDSLQACCSALTGVLATRAAFKRAGVGDATANASAATLVWILQDLTGMIGRILYAWRVSFLLDADCKQFRFYADILNDSALFIEVLSPMFLPREWFTLSACIATLLKSLCGVTGGATKAALSQHFAIRDNMADLHAKEGSQETVVGLVGLLLGSALMQLVPDDSIVLTWTFFVLFTSLHLVCNYRGICAIVMPSLNTQRAFLVIRHYLESLPTNTQIQNENDGFLTPLQVANRESIFWWRDFYCGREWGNFEAPEIQMGASLERVLEAWNDSRDWNGLLKVFSTTPAEALPPHFLALEFSEGRKAVILVALSEQSSSVQILLAFYHSLILQRGLVNVIGTSEYKNGLQNRVWRQTVVKRSLREFRMTKDLFLSGLQAAGWELEGVHQSRIFIHEEFRFNIV